MRASKRATEMERNRECVREKGTRRRRANAAYVTHITQITKSRPEAGPGFQVKEVLTRRCFFLAWQRTRRSEVSMVAAVSSSRASERERARERERERARERARESERERGWVGDLSEVSVVILLVILILLVVRIAPLFGRRDAEGVRASGWWWDRPNTGQARGPTHDTLRCLSEVSHPPGNPHPPRRPNPPPDRQTRCRTGQGKRLVKCLHGGLGYTQAGLGVHGRATQDSILNAPLYWSCCSQWV